MIASIEPNAVNWNVVIPIIVTGGGGLLVVGALWDRFKKNFAAKESEDRIRALELRVSSLEKQDGKVDQILTILSARRGRHE